MLGARRLLFMEVFMVSMVPFIRKITIGLLFIFLIGNVGAMQLSSRKGSDRRRCATPKGDLLLNVSEGKIEFFADTEGSLYGRGILYKQANGHFLIEIKNQDGNLVFRELSILEIPLLWRFWRDYGDYLHWGIKVNANDPHMQTINSRIEEDRIFWSDASDVQNEISVKQLEVDPQKGYTCGIHAAKNLMNLMMHNENTDATANKLCDTAGLLKSFMTSHGDLCAKQSGLYKNQVCELLSEEAKERVIVIEEYLFDFFDINDLEKVVNFDQENPIYFLVSVRIRLNKNEFVYHWLPFKVEMGEGVGCIRILFANSAGNSPLISNPDIVRVLISMHKLLLQNCTSHNI